MPGLLEYQQHPGLLGPPQSPASPAPFQRGAAEMLGLPDALKAWRGQMSEPEAQDFFMGAAMGLLPMRKALQGVGAAAKGIKAYHGSPYDFDRFDMSKIGTGEGAQAYGHGLYFAGNEKVAREYRDKLATGDFSNPQDVASSYLRLFSDRPTAIENLRVNANAYTEGQQVKPDVLKRAADLLESGVEPKNPGRMYEVNINAKPEQFLDWDRRIGDLPEDMRNALGHYRNSADQNVGDMLKRAFGNEYFAGDILGKDRASPVELTRGLAERGIPGAQYLDQGSRGAGDGTSNYVVWDDKLIDILRKYGLTGLPAGAAGYGAMQDQQ